MADKFILAGSGHRPPKLGLDYSEKSNELLRLFVIDELEKLKLLGRRPSLILSGMATGFDLAFAEASWCCGIPFVAVVPFNNPHENWPEEGQKRFENALECATELVTVCDGGYANWKYLKRDRYLVDHCSILLALFDEQGKGPSGTKYTVDYARGAGREVLNIWDSWLTFKALQGE